jgi:glycosyltransferase involved in cell wall biosynthesis
MKIAIEAQRIFRTNKHGMDFVALEAIRCLQKIDKDNEYFIFVANGEDHCLEETPNMHIVTLECPTYPLWEQWALPRAVKKVGADLLHCTSNTAPIFGSTPLVVTLHDIIFLEKQSGRNPSIYQALGRIYRRFVVPKILPKCKRIITVSKFERQRILSSLNLPPEKIVAIYNGYNSQFHPLEDFQATVSKYIQNDSYIFFLGNTDPKKNTPGTLKAYAEYVRKSHHPDMLLLADIDPKSVKIILHEIGEDGLISHIKFSGYIPNKDLPAIYNGASAFLYTSLRESFGIPILEAMACGTPVVTSNTSAIPEVAGDGAILVDPHNPSAICDALLRLEEDEVYRSESIKYCLDRVKLFSWESTAKNMLDLYEKIVNK